MWQENICESAACFRRSWEAAGEFSPLLSLEHRPCSSSGLCPALHPHPWTLNSPAIQPTFPQPRRWEFEPRGPHLPSSAPPPPALRRQTSRQDVPTGRLSRTQPRPLPRPRAKSAGSSAPPGSFPRDLHPASPPGRGEGGWRRITLERESEAHCRKRMAKKRQPLKKSLPKE